jgi:XTP/dITP diphosphohydrolase
VTPKQIVLATHNPHKREELQQVLERALPQHIEIRTLDDIEPTIGDIEEFGKTLRENAHIKADTVFRITGLPAIADDTGLEVDALNGAPGVYSARYAGENATYDDNVRKLLEAMSEQTQRTARFKTVICFVDSERTEYFEGLVEGRITHERRGSKGFGYDPVFAPSEDLMRRTFAEMPAEEKNAISHRGRALRTFAEWLGRQ